MYVTFNLLILEKHAFFENSLFMLPRQPIELRESDKSLITVENYSTNITVETRNWLQARLTVYPPQCADENLVNWSKLFFQH